MPFTASELIEGRPKPVVATPDELLQVALNRMIEHDFSQLPVVDGGMRPLGMVSADSIVRALSNFNVKVGDLRVKDAIKPAKKLTIDEDLLELLDELRDDNAGLVIDNEQRLVGIITSFDTTAFFRRQTEDIMVFEDVESAVRDLIESTAGDIESAEGKAKLKGIVDSLARSKSGLKKSFLKALTEYLKAAGAGTVVAEVAEKAFNDHLDRKPEDRSFSDLTFWEYTELLLSDSVWKKYSGALAVDKTALRTLLQGVGRTRNVLMHFRHEVKPEERQQLRFCRDWLARHRTPQTGAETSSHVPAPVSQAQASSEADEVVNPTDSRYAPLGFHLQNQSDADNSVTLRFARMEEIMGANLPPSARSHRSWWANDYVSHVQSGVWLEAGWRVTTVDLDQEFVTFARVREREVKYKGFFDDLLKDLAESGDSWRLPAGSQGRNWLTVGSVPKKSPRAELAATFAFGHRFRVELYINTGDRTENKQIFDALHSHKDVIETAVGQAVSWERLDHRNASRVAIYTDGGIEDSEHELTALRIWAVKTLASLRDAATPFLTK